MRKLLQSFHWAVNGLQTVWCEELNFRIEVIVSVIIVSLGAILNLLVIEWVFIILSIGAVFASEILNTAVEDLCNKVEPNTDPVIGKIKDTMGGFVLVVCTTAAAIGLTIFSAYL